MSCAAAQSRRLTIGIFGEEPQARGRFAPDLFEVGPDRGHPFVVQAVDPLRTARLLDHQPGVLEQSQMPRHRRSADREGVGDVPDRPATGTEQFDDLAPVRIAERVERIIGRCYHALSTRCFSPSANFWNDGPRSGIDLKIRPAIGPVYSSRMSNRTEPS